jgi:hypothetical protein
MPVPEVPLNSIQDLITFAAVCKSRSNQAQTNRVPLQLPAELVDALKRTLTDLQKQVQSQSGVAISSTESSPDVRGFQYIRSRSLHRGADATEQTLQSSPRSATLKGQLAQSNLSHMLSSASIDDQNSDCAHRDSVASSPIASPQTSNLSLAPPPPSTVTASMLHSSLETLRIYGAAPTAIASVMDSRDSCQGTPLSRIPTSDDPVFASFVKSLDFVDPSHPIALLNRSFRRSIGRYGCRTAFLYLTFMCPFSAQCFALRNINAIYMCMISTVCETGQRIGKIG